MTRNKILTDKDRDKAIEALAAEMETYESLPYHKLRTVDSKLFKDLFAEKGIKDSHFQYALQGIEKLYPQFTGHLSSLSEDEISAILAKEFNFLKLLSSKSSTPFYIINSLVSSYLSTVRGLGNAYRKQLSDEEFLELVELKKSPNVIDEEFETELQVADIEKILKSTVYDIDLRAFIFKAFKHKLKKGFEDYIILGVQYKPFTPGRLKKANLLHQYLFLLKYFKNNPARENNPEKVEFPPKPAEVMDTLIEYRQLGESSSSIYSKLCQILDLDK